MHTDSEAMGASNVEGWVRARLATPELADELRQPLTALLSELERERAQQNNLFLTVVIRTQAKRWEQLKDALLCLNAQTDQGFEVLIMLHEVSEKRAAELEALVAEYPSDFASRVKLVPVTGGGRARPLQASLQYLRSAYVSFYDDDDLLMADWVEAFRRGAEQAPGQVIRANVAIQSNKSEVWASGGSGQRTVSAATAEYARYFDFFAHLVANHTPFMGVAFPTTFFTKWGERFDEELPVCEDWDVLLRASALLGVTSVPELTAIYRRWTDAVTSYTAHDEEEWRAAEEKIRRRFESAPTLLSAGFVKDTEEKYVKQSTHERQLAGELQEVLHSTSWRVTRPLRKVAGYIKGTRPAR